jgi:phage-related protein
MSDGAVYVTFGGDSSELEASMASAKAAVSAMTRELAALARQQVAAGSSAETELGQHMLAVAAHLTEAREAARSTASALKEVSKPDGGEEEKEMLFLRMGESVKNLLSPVIELKGHFSELIEVIAAAFAVEKIADWASETTEAMEKVEQEAHRLGVSMESVQQLQAVSRLSGISYDDMASQFERMQLQLAHVGSASSPAAAALKSLGVSVAEFRAADAAKQLDLLAEASSRFADGGGKTAAVEALLGRAGAEMIPVLDRGREGLDEMRAAAERAGAVFSGEMVEAMAKTREHISELSLAWDALGRKAFAALNPAIDSIVVSLNRLIERVSQADIRDFALQMVDLGTAIRVGAVTALEQLDATLADFNTWSDRVQTILDAIGAKFAWLGDRISGVTGLLGGLFNVAGDSGEGDEYAQGKGAKTQGGAYGGLYAPDELQTMFSRNVPDVIEENALKAGLAISKATSDAKAWSDKMRELIAPRADAGHGAKDAGAEGAAKPQVPQMNLGGSAAKDASEAVVKAYADQVQAAQLAAQAIETTLDGELQRHQITSTQWLQKSLEALDKEQDAIQDAADKALASAALTSNQKLDVAHREAAQLGEIAQKVQQDQNKAAEATQKQWDSAFKEINYAFDSQIDGLLRGTTSWGQAFRNVLATLTEDVVKFFVNWGLQASERFVEDQVQNAARVAGHVAGNATMAASDQASAAAGGLAWIGQALKTLEADAASVFGGVFAFMAPALGPAAAGPAAAASGAVLAGAGAIASADIGMWQVPGDQLAMIHHNELIMPAPEAGAFRSMLSAMVGGGGSGAGGGDVHYHHYGNIVSNARDPRQVAKEVAAQFNRNPSIRPKY